MDKEIYFDSKDELKVTKLSDNFEFLKGKDLGKTDVIENGIFKFIRYGELYTSYNEHISEVISRTNGDSGVNSESGDILIPSSGEVATDLACASVVYEDGIKIGGDINILRKLNDDVDPLYVSYALNNRYRREITKRAQGTSVVHVYNKDLQHIKIAIPTVETQKKIAAKLLQIEKLIEVQSQQLHLLNQAKTYCLNHFIRPVAGNKKMAFSSFLKKDNDIIIIDDNRSYKQLTITCKGEILVRGTKQGNDIGRKRQYRFNYVEDVDKLLFVRQGIFNGGIGFADKQELDQAIVTENMPIFILDSKLVTKEYFKYYLKSDQYYRKVLANLNPIGSAQSAIHEKDWVKSIDTFPSLEKQQKIGTFLSKMDQLIECEQKLLEQLEKLKSYHNQQLIN